MALCYEPQPGDCVRLPGETWAKHGHCVIAGDAPAAATMHSPARIKVESPGVAPASLKRKRSAPLTPRLAAGINGLSRGSRSPAAAVENDAGATSCCAAALYLPPLRSGSLGLTLSAVHCRY